MANTYTLISSNTLGSNTASVTFSSIPSTYTDLVLRMSIRTNYSDYVDTVKLTFNGTTANYSFTRLVGDGGSVTSGRGSSFSYMQLQYADGNLSTTNTFANQEVYIPNYTVSANKPIGYFGVTEDNAASRGTYISIVAGLWSNTATISSIEIAPLNGPNFLTNSSFYLYGIKNS